MNHLKIVAPGRICLFGDHQDYLGLPVIACAINRKVLLEARINNEDCFHILMPDISSERRINIFDSFDELDNQDYFASAIRVVRRYGCKLSKGYTITLRSEIPINAGVSSSSAIVVAWVHFLLKAFGCNSKITSQLVAQIAFEAEVLEHNSPGGRMDQYTSAIGDIIYIDTAKNMAYEKIGNSIDGLILAESGIPKQTLGLLSHLRSNAVEAINFVSDRNPEFDIKKADLKDYERLSECLTNELKPYFYAAIKNHSITQSAYSAFQKKTIDMQLIGTLMNEHHQVLKNLLKITVPKIDDMINAAIEAGAYGAKIVGSGGGGSIVALSPPNKEKSIIKALLLCGAKNAYEVSVTNGTQVL